MTRFTSNGCAAAQSLPRRGPPAGGDTDLADALRQKTALLHEVDHRVKNNLQLVSSLLLLQARRADDPAARRALGDAQSRVNSVATVHRRLFQGDDVERFDVSAFIADLAFDAVGEARRPDIALRLELEPAHLDIARAAPLALLVGELLANVVRHAFPRGRPGTIRIAAGRAGPGRLRIEIADDGVGGQACEAGFGQTLVGLLCGQLKAECTTTDTKPGTRTVIRLPTEPEA